MKFINKTRITAFVLAAAAVVSLGSSSWAAYTGVKRSSFVASADLTRFVGKTDLSVSFKKVSDNSNVTNSLSGANVIEWSDMADPFANNVEWATASVYALVKSTLNSRGGVIQIYTDNLQLLADINPSNDTLVYDLVGSTTQAGVAISTIGLYPVYWTGTSSSTLGSCIPFAWRVSTGILTGYQLQPINYNSDFDHIAILGGADGNVGTTADNTYYPWFYMTDVSQGVDLRTPANRAVGSKAFNGVTGSYAQLQRAGLGLQVSEGAFAADADSDHYVYFAANFKNALDATRYKANVYIEAYKE